MARTTVTARKTTGGRAPRKTGPRSDPPLAPPAAPTDQMVVERQPRQQDFCYICVNGGELWACDQCTRVICRAHIILPPNSDVGRFHFVCVACHLRVFPRPTPYFGFYKGVLGPNPESWVPALKEPLVVQADYQLTASSQVVSESLVLLHFILCNIRPQGNPARTASELLTAFLPDESFMYKEIVFDLATDKLTARYTADMMEFVKTLKNRDFDRVVIVITNHSHDDTGDLYLGPNLCTSVEEFMHLLLPPILISYIQPRSCTLMLMCCGALVREQKSFSDLSAFVRRASINDLIAFTAPEFHPALITSFFVDFTQRILIEGYDIDLSMKPLLQSNTQNHLARHTNIVHIQYNADTSSLISLIYIFTHPKWRPWGNRLPTTCPKCSSPHPWSDVIKQGSTYSFTCRNGACQGLCSFSRPEGYEAFTMEVNGGRWVKKEYRV